MMNEQELFERFDRIAEALERMATGVDHSTETIDSETTARRELTQEEKDAQDELNKRRKLEESYWNQQRKEKQEIDARVRRNFDELGASIKYVQEGNAILGKIERQRVTEDNLRKKAEEQLNKALEENDSTYKKLSESGKERYKAELRNEAAMTKAYAAIGRTIDQYGKVTKETDHLTLAQRAYLDILKQMDEVQRQMAGNVLKLGADLGKLAIKGTFDLFVAGIKGAYEGTIAYQNAILDGAGANAAAAAQVSAEMNALAGALESTGSSMVSLGAEAAKTAVQMIILGGPIGALVGVIMLLVGAVVAYEGYEKEAQAKKMKRDAELQAKQAAIYDQLYKDFTQLSSASLTSAGGMTTLWKQLGQVSMSVKDFGKFNKILVEGSASLATFASSAVEGVQKFTDVAGSVIKSGLGDVFRQMGLTNEEMAAHTLKYMEQQRSLGTLQNKSATDLKIGTANYIRELDRVAALTGQSRKDQEKGRDAIRAMAQVSAAKNIAMQRGDTKQAGKLGVVEELAGGLKATMPEFAAALAKRVSGAALDSGQVAMMKNQGELLRYIDSGGKDQVKMQMLVAQGLEKQDKGNAFLVRTVGEVAGYTQDNFADRQKFEQQIAGLRKAEADAKKAGKPFDAAAFLDKQREVTDPFTKAQADAAQKAKETQIAFEKNVMGLSTEFPNIMKEMIKKLPESLSGPIMKFFEYVEQFGRYVLKFIGDPSDTLKETLTGKDKSQRDAENLIDKQKELKSVEERIKSLKESTENPEKAKKQADEKFKLAEQELKLKEQAVTDLNIQMNKEKDPKKRELLAIQGSAKYLEEKEAKEKYRLAKKSVEDNETGFFSKSIETKKKELADLEKRKLGLANETTKLEQQVKSNPASTTAAGFAKTYGSSPAYSMAMAGGKGGGGSAGAMGAGDPSGGGSGPKPELKSVTSKSGPSAQVNKNVADNFQNLINHLDMAGYKINDMGGYNNRKIAGTDVMSAHAQGAALDINEKTNPMGSKLITDMPENIGTIAGNLGLGWGGNWQSKKDAMHFSATRSEGGTLMAKTGGVFNGPPGGYPVELHGREAVVPLPNPGDKISIDKGQQDGGATKSALSSVVADNNTTSSKDNSSAILMDLYSMMESKFDDLIDKVSTTNTYTNKLLKYSQV